MEGFTRRPRGDSIACLQLAFGLVTSLIESEGVRVFEKLGLGNNGEKEGY